MSTTKDYGSNEGQTFSHFETKFVDLPRESRLRHQVEGYKNDNENNKEALNLVKKEPTLLLIGIRTMISSPP